MSRIDIENNGAAQAALLSAGIGVMTLALVNLGCEASEPFKALVYGIGKRVVPGGGGIGPYSGKEILALAAWLGSWLILHVFLRARQMNSRAVAAAFLVAVGAATTLLWPPVTHFLVMGR